MTLDCRQFWTDERLRFDVSKSGVGKLVVGAEYIKLIWVPDTFFVNEKTAQFHSATQDNQFLRITARQSSPLHVEDRSGELLTPAILCHKA